MLITVGALIVLAIIVVVAWISNNGGGGYDDERPHYKIKYKKYEKNDNFLKTYNPKDHM